MTNFAQACLLFPIGWVCGILNSIAGGGGIIIFPTLILIGLPPISANATGTIISLPGHIVGAIAYRRELQAEMLLCWLFGSVGVLGGALGALLLLWIPAPTFDGLVPYLLLMAMLLFSFSDIIANYLPGSSSEDSQNSYQSRLRAVCVLSVVAIYGGFYGLGISFLILAALRLLGMRDIQVVNGLKLLLISCIYSLAAVMFIWSEIVAWPQGLVMMAGATMGGYNGAYCARRLDPKWVKRFIVAVGFTMTGYFFIRHWKS